MSRSKRRESGEANPITNIISYRPNSGEFQVYNKPTKARSTRSSLDIIILDADRNSLSGYANDYDAGIICNSVLNTRVEELVVGIFKDGKYKEIKRGFYQDIKNDIEGGKYTRDVYCLLVEDGNYELSLLQLTGMARNQFDDYFKDASNKALANVLTLTPSKDVYNYSKKTKTLEVVPKSAQAKWRTTWLKSLEFTGELLTKSQDELAYAEDEVIQNYLSASAGTEESAPAPKSVEAEEEDEDGPLPF
jgi:hypothetical protein